MMLSIVLVDISARGHPYTDGESNYTMWTHMELAFPPPQRDVDYR